jgi:hypothetical protein
MFGLPRALARPLARRSTDLVPTLVALAVREMLTAGDAEEPDGQDRELVGLSENSST